MKTLNQETPIVAIAHARSFEKNDAFLTRHQPLVNRLAEYGVKSIALNGAKDRVEGSEFSRHYTFHPGSPILEPVDTMISIDAAYDITGGIAKYTPDIAALNPLGVRELAMSKARQFDALHQELGETVPQTLLVIPEKAAVESAIDDIVAEKVILKSNTDVEKKFPMIFGTKDEVRAQLDAFLAAYTPEQQILIQEYMPEVNNGFDSRLRPINSQESDIVRDLDDAQREIRVHVIDGEPYLVHGRAGVDPTSLEKKERWVYFDQESVPRSILDLAATAAKLIQSKANAKDSYLAVDLTPDGSRIIEVNGRNIGTIREQQDRPASIEPHKKSTDAIAQKLTSMAQRKKE